MPAVLATDLPGLAATCEAYRAGLLGQPVTALTTLGFVLAGVAVWAGRPAPAGYRLPFEVTDRDTALKLAVHVEDGVAQAWRVVLPVTEDAERADALSALTESAVRATRWRRLAEVTPLTLPFPGRPSS